MGFDRQCEIFVVLVLQLIGRTSHQAVWFTWYVSAKIVCASRADAWSGVRSGDEQQPQRHVPVATAEHVEAAVDARRRLRQVWDAGASAATTDAPDDEPAAATSDRGKTPLKPWYALQA